MHVRVSGCELCTGTSAAGQQTVQHAGRVGIQHDRSRCGRDNRLGGGGEGGESQSGPPSSLDHARDVRQCDVHLERLSQRRRTGVADVVVDQSVRRPKRERC